MKRRNKIIRSILLLILAIALVVIFLSQKSKEKEAEVIKIKSNYVDTVECARNIMKENRTNIDIDENISVNPVVYEVEMMRNNRDEKAVMEYFIKEYTKQQYIKEMSELYCIEVSKDEIDGYVSRMTMNMMRCELEEQAILNGFSCFNDYINDAGTRECIANDIRLGKLAIIKENEKDKEELKMSKSGCEGIKFVSIDEELTTKYLEYINN